MAYWLKAAGVTALVLAAGLWALSLPDEGVSATAVDELQGRVENGERLFHIGGCASCHRAPDAEAPALHLSGGKAFATPFGTFIAPNITPHTATGIGTWSTADFATAMLEGVSPQGEHYYPAFPYTAYGRMRLQDIVDLKAYLDTLPAIDRDNPDHELAFPFNQRWGLGLWKRLYQHQDAVVRFENPSPQLLRGQYLVEGPGHCGECHTPRTPFGGLDTSGWLAGAPNPDGDGRIPNITPHPEGIGEWETVDITGYLATGFTPEYDVVGGSMADVVDNLAQVPEADLQAMAAYLKAIPALAAPEEKH